jgi:hypothetical protein
MPMYFGLGTPCKAFTLADHAMYKTFLETSSTIHIDPVSAIRIDVKGNSFDMQTAIN